MRRFAAGLAVTSLAITMSWSLALRASADTHGNSTKYEANSANDPYSTCTTGPSCSVQSYWWSGTTMAVTQRYGCSLVTAEPDGPPSWCPFPYNVAWHQGIDIGISQSTSLYSQVNGTVAAYATRPDLLRKKALTSPTSRSGCSIAAK